MLARSRIKDFMVSEGKLTTVLWVDARRDLCTVGTYFACVMILCTVSVAMAVLVLNLHNRSPDAYAMPAAVSCCAIMIVVVVVVVDL